MTPAVQIHEIGTARASTIDDTPTITLSPCVRAPARATNACSSDSPSAFRLRDRQPVLGFEPAEERVVLEPDPAHQRERGGERDETAQRLLQRGEILRNLERHDQQRQAEAKDRVAESLDA